MVEFEGEKQKPSRIQWTDADLENGESPQPQMNLHRSNSSMSINSMHSRRGSIDPASALPIQYRTVSIQIDEPKEKKEAAAKGSLYCTSIRKI
jgi:sodium/potassium-transporting ATPase subunit alpha